MIHKILLVLSVPDLRRKLAVTVVLLAVYRLGFVVPLPIVNQEQLAEATRNISRGQGGALGQVLQTASLFSAAAVGYSTIFGLGIMPYISCSIVFQLLTTVYPPLERLQKEGESGRRRLNEWTRQLTVPVAFMQSIAWIFTISRGSLGAGSVVLEGCTGVWYVLATGLMMTAGTMFLVWIGEQIDAFGLGNGVSLLIMAGIMAQMPNAVFESFRPLLVKGVSIGVDGGVDKLLLMFSLFVLIVVGVVFVTLAQRKIPVQSAKHVRGRRMFGGAEHYLPLKVNQSGVMPIIFASSLLMIPAYLYGQVFEGWGFVELNAVLSGAALKQLCYASLIFFFSYFWTAITFNPQEVAKNLKDYGSFIPGYRPGERTSRYLEHVAVRITFVGATFLSVLAVLPSIVSGFTSVNPVIANFYGGTGLLIVVSVSIDMISRIDSHLLAISQVGLTEH